ncbi:MAG TPA: tRNA pseudouridine(38-40) synthase TruA [Gammaproteobacteria bacterium]
MRIALTLEYDGSDFSGWQVQPGRRTVQGELERALTQIADHPVQVTCAGRTDAGVHARGQVVHFDTGVSRPWHAWVMGGNSRLPPDVAIRSAQAVDDDFHARFSAVRRSYVYRVANQPTRPALARARCWWVHRALELEPMQAAAACLLGVHDFSSFRAAQCQARQPVRTLYRLEVTRTGSEFCFRVEANAFLHHMVRNLVGALLAVGSGAQPVTWMAELLARRDRRAGAVTAPAQGLCFDAVRYPERYRLGPADAVGWPGGV